MKRFLSDNERKELESLKRDLVDPVKRFAGEVYADTVGDAKKFYSGKARQAREGAEQVRQSAVRAAERTKEQMAALAQKREEQQKRRRASTKRLAITIVLFILAVIAIVSIALSVRNGKADPVTTAESARAETAAISPAERAQAETPETVSPRESGQAESTAEPQGDPVQTGSPTQGYRSIPREEAAYPIKKVPAYVILNVRTREEYDGDRIPCAV